MLTGELYRRKVGGKKTYCLSGVFFPTLPRYFYQGYIKDIITRCFISVLPNSGLSRGLFIRTGGKS